MDFADITICICVELLCSHFEFQMYKKRVPFKEIPIKKWANTATETSSIAVGISTKQMKTNTTLNTSISAKSDNVTVKPSVPVGISTKPIKNKQEKQKVAKGNLQNFNYIVNQQNANCFCFVFVLGPRCICNDCGAYITVRYKSQHQLHCKRKFRQCPGCHFTPASNKPYHVLRHMKTCRVYQALQQWQPAGPSNSNREPSMDRNQIDSPRGQNEMDEDIDDGLEFVTDRNIYKPVNVNIQPAGPSNSKMKWMRISTT